MLSKTLDAALRNIGLTVTPDHAYGIYGGYLITVSESGNKKQAFFNFLLEEEEESEDSSLAAFEISEAVKSNLDTFSVIDYSLHEDGLDITSGSSIPDFLKMIDFCVELLNEHKVKGSDYCSGCGKQFGKRYPKKLTSDNKNYLMCESCTLDVLEERDKPTAETDASSKTSLSAILGALGGGLIGIALFYVFYRWVIPFANEWGSWDPRYAVTVIGFLVAFLTYTGYRLFFKKASLAAYITVSAVSVMAAVAGQYIGIIVNILNDFSIRLSQIITVYPKFLLMPLRSTAVEGYKNYSSDFYIFAAISVLLAVFGAIIFLLGMYEKSKVVIEKPKVETLRINKG